MNLTDLLTIGGASILTNLLMEVGKRTLALPESTVDRFGSLAAMLLGIAIVVVVTVLIAPVTLLAIAQAVLVGMFAGFQAIGIYKVAGKATA